MSTLAPLVTVHHVKCGGRIIPIPTPPFVNKAPQTSIAYGEFGACERCGLRGELVEVAK
jgi:hypothetical protein